MNKEFLKACERVSNIDFDNIKVSDRKSDLYLLMEYARRVSILKITHAELEIENVILFNSERIFNITSLPDVNENCKGLYNIKNSIIRFLCVSYLQYIYILGEGNQIAKEFDDLFEPLIKLFERGGMFNRHHGEYIIGGGAWVPSYPEIMLKEKPIDISDEALEIYDNK